MAEEPAVKLYHRLASASEEALVRASGWLWEKPRRQQWGNGPPAVKAFLGPLPRGPTGYIFSTETPPTRFCMFMGMRGAEWQEGGPGVGPVPDDLNYVRIAVKVSDDSSQGR